jgi:hypothetical protein
MSGPQLCPVSSVLFTPVTTYQHASRFLLVFANGFKKTIKKVKMSFINVHFYFFLLNFRPSLHQILKRALQTFLLVGCELWTP